MNGSEDGYKPGTGFEEDTKDPLIDISLTDSTELWLIQWPINQLKAADFHGKELKLKLHRDGQLGSLESSSGKSYDVVSFAAQEPDATVFLPSSSESKVVGKISRRVCLVRYPEASEFEKPGFRNLNLSRQRSEGSMRKSMSRSGKFESTRDTLTSVHSLGPRSVGFLRHSNKKKRQEDSTPNSDISLRSAEHTSGPESQITNTSLGSEESKKKKKKKIKVEE
uniref:Mediator-associated protein 2 n=1 Tax=Elaeis guineensis var. tenera TaxID=51953 RepID=A0A6I9SF66_ELAGV|nr:mediator-associated protein 2 [Elaeis guineensis]XP_010942356.1 mediator-associated protein 2 [Elaeis guineensis]XP_010942357.1 mediator-associated protein 2 [Elaeis guineensis]